MRAACRGDHVDRYFNDEGERGPTKRARDESAKAVCAGCPVKAVCLNWALTVGEAYGVWGGTTPSERDSLTKAAVIPLPARTKEPALARATTVSRVVA
jgi:WhiB family redox-sensing transcriptional regulator